MKNQESFRQTLPSDLVLHVTSICGSRGVAWLDGLPDAIRALEQKWSFEVGDPFPAGEFNFVAAATRPDGERLVLKIAPPFETNEMLGEARFLRTRDGRGAVRLLEEDVERRAILIERAFPGQNLTERFADSEPECVEPAIEVLRSILGPPPADLTQVTTLDEWFDALRRYQGGLFPADYVTKALRIYDRLSVQPERTYYLHGDFHPGNAVTATRSPYLAIDPKGIVGHVGYDIAVFLNNLHWWQEKRPDIESRLRTAVRQFSDAFDLDEYELRQWAFAQMVLSAWWSFDEMPEHYDGKTVLKADIWNV